MVTKVEINNDVTFTDNSIGKDGTATYTWDFGDGSASSTTNPTTHRYTSIGIYNVTHSVKNSCNQSPSICSTQQVEVVPVGQAGNEGSNSIIFIGIAAVAAVVMFSKK